MNIIIVDYGMGNLRSIQKRFDQFGSGVNVSNNLTEIEKADKLILPGVGHFKNAVKNLKESKIWDLLNFKVLEQKTPILGICLGLQLMAKSSEEGNETGFNWFDARVVKFTINDKLKYKVPHTGWNNISIKKEAPLLKGIEANMKFYFVHSYHIEANNSNEILTETDYEYRFISSLCKDNIFGVQFHPEKSHEQGNLLLKNFYNL
jgi:imidazole glycerol-phosphate synthase subunit HisH